MFNDLAVFEADLIDLGHDFELKPIFNKQQYEEFWLQQAVTGKYPSLWKVPKLFSDFIIFDGEGIQCGVTNFNKSQEPSQFSMSSKQATCFFASQPSH